MAMAKDQRAPRGDVIEIAIAIDVDEVGPLAAVDDDGLPTDAAKRPRRAVDTAGDDGRRPRREP